MTCRNCGAPLPGPYCAACGQPVQPRPITLRGFFRRAAAELLNLDRGALHTE